jgi:hypothetical protein
LVARVVPGAVVRFPRRTDRRIKYSWNGRVLRPSGLTIESVCHEVAHVLVAAASRRALPEFGLGPDPYRHSDARRVIPDDTSADEERDACAMQLVLVRLLGLSEADVMAEVRPEPLTTESLRELERRHPDALPPPSWRRVEAGLE